MSTPRALGPLLALALVAAAAPAMAQEASTIRVAADGSAEHRTIAAALEAAAPGDIILIAPGEYVENPHIDTPVTLRGDGPREDVVIAPDLAALHYLDVPDTSDLIATHVHVDGVDATLERLTLADVEEVQAGLMLAGGNPVVRDVSSSRVTGINGAVEATIEGSELGRIILMGSDARMTVRNNTLREGVVVGMGAGGLVEGNVILDLPIDILERSSLEVRGNTFRPETGAPAIWVDWSGASATIVDNVIEGAGHGVHVDHASSVLIEGNTITAPEYGIVVTETGAVIRDNVVTGASEAGLLVSGNGITAEDNTVTGGRVGVIASIPNGYPPGAPRFDEPARIEGNEITGASHFGLLVNEAAPVVTGNTICAEREPLRLENDASPQLGTNEMCEVPG